MSQVIRDELSRLKTQKAALDVEASVLKDKASDLYREREDVLNTLSDKRRELFTAAEQIEKLEEFLRIEE